MNYSELKNDLISTLKSPDLQEIFIEASETGIDAIIDEGIARDLPIIRILYSGIRVAHGISNYLLVKKILTFLGEQSQIDNQQRVKMIQKINKSRSYKIKVGEKLLYILDKCDDHYSALLIGQLFAAFIKEEIKYSDFLKGASIINGCFIDDLARFINSSSELFDREGDMEEIPNEDDLPLISVGLLGFGFNNPKIERLHDWRHEEVEDQIRGKGVIYVTSVGEMLRKHLKIQL